MSSLNANRFSAKRSEDEVTLNDNETDNELEHHGEQIRAILWTCPRAVSTAFERCMSMAPNSKIFNELYSAAFLVGPDRSKRSFPQVAPHYSYRRCKERLEADHHGYEFIFAKEFPYNIHLHMDMIPKGYQHTFLIRHPLKTYPSLRKMFRSSWFMRLITGGAKIRTILPVERWFYRGMWDLYTYFKENPAEYPTAIIIDADDLIKDPEAIIQKYCESIGLAFHPDMLKWDMEKLRRLPWEMANILYMGNWLMGCYKHALNSTGFVKGGIHKKGNNDSEVKDNKNDVPGENTSETDRSSSEQAEDGKIENSTKAARSGKDEHSLPLYIEDLDLTGLFSEVREAIKSDLPFYKKLYECRLSLEEARGTDVAKLPSR